MACQLKPASEAEAVILSNFLIFLWEGVRVIYSKISSSAGRWAGHVCPLDVSTPAAEPCAHTVAAVTGYLFGNKLWPFRSVSVTDVSAPEQTHMYLKRPGDKFKHPPRTQFLLP